MKEQHCVACHGPLGFFGPRHGAEYHLCRNCRTLQLCPMPEEEKLTKAYAEKYAGAGQTDEFDDPDRWRRAGHNFRQCLVDTLRQHKISGTILDVGAGWGFLCELLEANNFTCRGIEVSTKMTTYAQQHNLAVERGDMNSLAQMPDRFGAIVMCAVFEHIVNHDRWMQVIHQKLDDGGVFVSLHPTAACYQLLGTLLRLGNRNKELPGLHGSFAPPWHTALFSVPGMQALAVRNGFLIDDIRPAPQGRFGGALEIIQICQERVNRLGWRIWKTNWPLVTTHVFVMKKESN